MPWVRHIHLIVSNPEQVPSFINKEKTKVVLHKDIIPAQYLPTFNSSTIEMFISNIEGLAEHFIYANDDMYPTKDMKKSDFFDKSGRPKVAFKRNWIIPRSTYFNQLCCNDYQHILTAMGRTYREDSYLLPDHTMTSMVKSHCKDCLKLM